MTIKMVITDLDGTLLDSKEAVSEANIRAFTALKQQGILCVVATGRIENEARYAFELIGATEYFIGMNGAQILNLKTKEIIAESFLSPITAQKVFDVLHTAGVFFQIYSQDDVICTPDIYEKRLGAGINKEYLARFGDSIRVCTSIVQPLTKTNKFFAVVPDRAQEAYIYSALQEMGDISLVSAQSDYLEIIPKTIHKGIAVAHLCRHLNISLENVLAIGDSDNDLEMLKTVGISIAMGNAHPHIKDVADYVVASNDDNGVAHAIDQLILRR